MPLLYLVGVLIVVGMGLWLINTYIPMARSIKTILNVVVVVAVVVWVLKAVWAVGKRHQLPSDAIAIFAQAWHRNGNNCAFAIVPLRPA
jgi:hypothetical protein